MPRLRRTAFAVVLILAQLVLVGTGSASSLVPVRVQLKWLHQFQFAGLYAALERGYFEEAGLDVTILEGGPSVIPSEEVVSGRAEFGIGSSGLIVSRSAGLPVVAVAAIFQHSPYMLVVRDEARFASIEGLHGERIMVEPYAEELVAWLNFAGLPPGSYESVEHTGNPFDLMGESPRAVAMTAYSTTEPIQLAAAGVSFRGFEPKYDGIDFYGDTLFAAEAFVEANPALVVAFRDAMVRGWHHAFENPEETARLISTEYGSPLSYEELLAEGREIRRLLIPDLIEIGYMNPLRWQHIHDVFDEAGLIESPVDLEAFIFEPPAAFDWATLRRVMLGVLALLLVVSLFSFRLFTLNRRLEREVRRRREMEEELRHMALTDHGTGLLNRRGFLEQAAKALALAVREERSFSLVMLDLDHFKDVNDTYGHAAGDRALRHFATLCGTAVRASDIPGRIGGEEFAIALPSTSETCAIVVAERLRADMQGSPLDLDGREVPLTVSMGIAEHVPGEELDDLLRRADDALYSAKSAGRDRICLASGAVHASMDEVS